ncbi:MAG: hypothetical protein A2Y33_01705 [Spirochaetes bacterium GWF1_51_8]|nr:MAG: hypothetical protein A2Y33_01705 [Spirochaetes bacterium GWF1_51_8]
MKIVTKFRRDCAYKEADTNNTNTLSEEKVLHIVRKLDVPARLVFAALTEADRIREWWGPKNYATPFAAVDLRVGGKFHYCMRSPDGADFWGIGIFREIVPNKKLVYTDSFSDKDGNIVPPEKYGLPAEWPIESIVEVTLEEQASGTLLTIHSSAPSNAPQDIFDGSVQGWNEMIDKLAEYVVRARW